jgi:hypothetical protein
VNQSDPVAAIERGGVPSAPDEYPTAWPNLAGPAWDDLMTRFGSVGLTLTLFDPIRVYQRSPGDLV